jgi:hypothetical protein
MQPMKFTRQTRRDHVLTLERVRLCPDLLLKLAEERCKSMSVKSLIEKANAYCKKNTNQQLPPIRPDRLDMRVRSLMVCWMAFYIDCLNEDEDEDGDDDESRPADENVISGSMCFDGLEDDNLLMV